MALIFQSPHQESYERFRSKGLLVCIKNAVQAVLDGRREYLDFVPNVTVKLSEAQEQYPSGDDERVAWFSRSDLVQAVIASISLDDGGTWYDWNPGVLPWMTDRGSFIMHGSECFVIGQLRPSPGVFFTWEDPPSKDGTARRYIVRDAVCEVRPRRGVFLRISRTVEPNPGDTWVRVANGRRVELDALLTAVGVSIDEHGAPRETESDRAALAQVASAFGWQKNDVEIRLFGSVLGPLGREQLNRRIHRLGVPYNEDSELLTRRDLGYIAALFNAFVRDDGKIPEDDPWDLGNLELRRTGDQLESALDAWARRLRFRFNKLLGKSRGVLDMDEAFDKIRAANVSGIDETHFTRCARQWTVRSALSQRVPRDRNNRLAAASLTRRVAYKGLSGGSIGHERAPRQLHWSHYGRLCPLDTPLSTDIGVVLSLTADARVNELGIVEARCHRVEHDTQGHIVVGSESEYVSPWRECDAQSDGWIAFPDQGDALRRGESVQAHRGVTRLASVPACDVRWIHAGAPSLYSLAANLIPFRQHNDSVRGAMACNMLRQALPLEHGTAPRCGTGMEQSFPQAMSFGGGFEDQGQLAFGAELLVGYLPWKGWNFEDAIVISESAADQLTSVHDTELPFRLFHTQMEHQKTAFEYWKARLPEIAEMSGTELDQYGIVKKGAAIGPNKVLIVEPVPASPSEGENAQAQHCAETDVSGVVHGVATRDDAAGASVVITVRDKKRARVGDKLANRHGHKGVISLILPNHKMPYFHVNGNTQPRCECGETKPHRHLQVLINPLGVISRMNLGQLHETEARQGTDLGNIPAKAACFDPDKSPDRKLEGDVLVGYQYLMKLDHNAADKVSARSFGKPDTYSAFAQQPLGGSAVGKDASAGGQRLGEMEVWALMAHNASGLLREMLTLKSDNPGRPRRRMVDLAHYATLGGDIAELPEGVHTLAAILYGLGIEATCMNMTDAEAPLLQSHETPGGVKGLGLRVLDQNQYTKIAKGEVRSAKIDGARRDAYEIPDERRKRVPQYDPQGLESEQIFGPVESYTCACGFYRYENVDKKHDKTCEICGTDLIPSSLRRRRMGYIQLARPLVNPYLALLADEDIWKQCFSLTRGQLRAMLEDSSRLIFTGWSSATAFLNVALKTSKLFRKRFDECVEGTQSVQLQPQLAGDWTAEGLEKFLGSYQRQSRGKSAGEVAASEGDLPEDLEMDEVNRKGIKSRPESFNKLLAEIFGEHKGISSIDVLVELLEATPQTRHFVIRNLLVIPPVLRTPYRMPSGELRHHELTEAYVEVLEYNSNVRILLDPDGSKDETATQGSRKRKKKLRSLGEEARDLQRAVARLMCNQLLRPSLRARCSSGTGPFRRARQSLSSFLEGKRGLFVGHLFGKRVDFSGRAVIVPDPTLDIDECKICPNLAMDLFGPLLPKAIRGLTDMNPEEIKGVIERARRKESQAVELVNKALASVMKDHPILLNRQPTLHRLGMLAFKAQPGQESVIALPPLVTTGYNADFDGDQMALYLPLTKEGIEDTLHMFPSRQLWHPAHGGYALSLAQDLTFGLWLDGKTKSTVVNEIQKKENTDSRGAVIGYIYGSARKLFESVTAHGLSFSLEDFNELWAGNDPNETVPYSREGMERALNTLSQNNSVGKIIRSGARGDVATLVYLAGRVNPDRHGSNLCRGLTEGELLQLAEPGRSNNVDTKLSTAESGTLTKELVSLGNYYWITKEDCQAEGGLQVTAHEGIWLMLNHVARNSAIDKVRKHLRDGDRITHVLRDMAGWGIHTASANLNIQEVSQQDDWEALLSDHPKREMPRVVAVRMQRTLRDTKEDRERLFYRLYGRVLSQQFMLNGENLPAGTLIGKAMAESLAEALIRSSAADVEVVAWVRSALMCKESSGICQRCYGLDWSRGRHRDLWRREDFVERSARVGILAAQAVGEPGTQMALRKKHLALVGQNDDDPLMGVDAVRDLFRCGNSLWKHAMLLDLRDTLDYVYRSRGICVAPIHFEVLLAAFTHHDNKGWIADTAEAPRRRVHSVLVAHALTKNSVDQLRGLKEKVMIGAVLPTDNVARGR